MIKIVITVEGGVVQDVSSDNPGAIEVFVIDHDEHEVAECVVTHETTRSINRIIEGKEE